MRLDEALHPFHRFDLFRVHRGLPWLWRQYTRSRFPFLDRDCENSRKRRRGKPPQMSANEREWGVRLDEFLLGGLGALGEKKT
jgi:hypothetical protein